MPDGATMTYDIFQPLGNFETEGLCTFVSGRLFVKCFTLCYQTVLCPVCPVLSVTSVYCGRTVEWIKMKRGV